MQFSTLAVLSAFVAAAQAVNFTVLVFSTVTAGKPFELSWAGAEGPVTILLKNGSPLDLQTVSTVASGLSGNSYTWDVPATLPADTYALEIVDGSDTNYSPQFELIGGVRSSTAVSGSVSVTRSPTASSTGTGSITVTETTSSVITESSGTTPLTTRTSATTNTRTTQSPTSTPSSAPAGGMASGLTSNLALVFVAAGALFMIN